MGSMMRRLRRQGRRRLGEVVDRVLTFLDELEDEAYDQQDDDAFACCQDAYDQIVETLTPDGYPTDATQDALLDAVAGPVARAMARLRPDLPLPPGAGGTRTDPAENSLALVND